MPDGGDSGGGDEVAGVVVVISREVYYLYLAKGVIFVIYFVPY